jgi:hypothetical protein
MLPQAVKEDNRTNKTIIKSRGKAKAANSRVALALHVHKGRETSRVFFFFLRQAVFDGKDTMREEKGICSFFNRSRLCTAA